MLFHPSFQHKYTTAAQVGARSLGHALLPFIDAREQSQVLLSCCAHCGMQIVIDSDDCCIKGEAATLRCEPNTERALESQAWLVGQNPTLLLAQLEAEVERQEPEIRARFNPGQFDPGNFRLLSQDGTLEIRWELRENPNAPISPENPQTALGITRLEHRVTDEQMEAAYYIGPRLNPNGVKDSLFWLVRPLEPGEYGLVYQDARRRLRFRRSDGVVGYYINWRDVHRHPVGQPPLSMQEVRTLVRETDKLRWEEQRAQETQGTHLSQRLEALQAAAESGNEEAQAILDFIFGREDREAVEFALPQEEWVPPGGSV